MLLKFYRVKRALWLFLTLLVSLLLPAQVLANVDDGWLPNVVHFINHSPKIEPRQPVMQMPESSVNGGFVIDWAMYDRQSHQFLVEYQLVGNDNWQLLYQGSNTQFTTSSPWSGGQYNIRISCANDEHCPIEGYLTDNITLIDKPQQPVLYVNSDQVLVNSPYELSFIVDSNVDNYQLFESDLLLDTLQPSVGQQVITVAQNKANIGLLNYQLKACNTAGCSELSLAKTVAVYVPVSMPSLPGIKRNSYPINIALEIVWPEILSGQHLRYFYAFSQDEQLTNVQVYKLANEFNGIEPLTFADTGYLWSFVKSCNNIDQCSDYSDPRPVQIFTKPEQPPLFCSLASYEQEIDPQRRILSVPLVEDDAPFKDKFFINCQSPEGLAPYNQSYYRILKNGKAESNIHGVAGYVKKHYENTEYAVERLPIWNPNNGGDKSQFYHAEFNINSRGKYVYSLQACNSMGGGISVNPDTDCGPATHVTVYADMPLPLVPTPENSVTELSISVWGHYFDVPESKVSNTGIEIRENEKIAIHFQPSTEYPSVEFPEQKVFYQLSLDGQPIAGYRFGSDGTLDRLHKDDLLHYPLTLEKAGQYQLTVAACISTGYENSNEVSTECGPASKPLAVTVNAPELPINSLSNFSVNLAGQAVIRTNRYQLAETSALFDLHWDKSDELSPKETAEYAITVNSLAGKSTEYIDADSFSPSFRTSLNTTGSYQYQVQGCNQIDNSRRCGPANMVVEVDVYDSSSVLTDSLGNLYFKDNASRLKLTPVGDSWQVSIMIVDDWNALFTSSALRLSDYQLSFNKGNGIYHLILNSWDNTNQIIINVYRDNEVTVSHPLSVSAVKHFLVDEQDQSNINHGESVSLSWVPGDVMPDDAQYHLYVTKPGEVAFLWKILPAGTHSISRGGDTGIQRSGTQLIALYVCPADTTIESGECSIATEVAITVDGPPPVPWLFEVDNNLAQLGEQVSLNWAMHVNYQKTASYQLFVDKPGSSILESIALSAEAVSLLYTIEQLGEYIFYLQACDTKEGCSEFSVVTVDMAAEAIVYQTDENNQYVQLPSRLGGKYIKISKNLETGVWVVTELEITPEEWAVLSLRASDYTIEFGEFAGNELEDFKLISSDTSTEIIFSQTDTGYEHDTSATQRTTIFIHTDLLGSPVAETNANGVVL